MQLHTQYRPPGFTPIPAPLRFERWFRLLNARLTARDRKPAAREEARALYDCLYSPAEAAAVLG